MSIKKKVGFLGSFQIDFVVYTARILSCMKKKVLVVDATGMQEFSHFFPDQKKNLPVISQCNVDYTTQKEFENAAGGDYDFLLFYFGAEIEKEAVQGFEELFAVSFCDRTALEKLRLQMKNLKMPMDVILRNICEAPTERRRYFAYLEKENIFIAESIVLPFDEIDESYRIRMQYEPAGNFKGISASMEKALLRVVNIICPSERAEMKEAIRKAKKGVWL